MDLDILPWEKYDLGNLWSNLPADYRTLIEASVDADTLRSALETIRSMIEADTKLFREVYPPPSTVFTALELCPVDKVRVVILGQDPYIHGGQAHGLAFSVLDGRPPPSLRNVYDRILDDTKTPPLNRSGDLRHWAQQGVLLLNSVLTVRHKTSNAHSNAKGWPVLTGAIIDWLSVNKQNLVFILWGRPAQLLAKRVDGSKHLLLKASHPSPLGCHSAAPVPFDTCNHFSECNKHLVGLGQPPIRW